MDKIIEGNILIAEFMGFIPHKPLKKGIFGTREMVWYYKEKNFWSALFYVNSFKYHSSWDWLIPVIEKIGEQPSLGDAPHPTDFRVGIYSNIIRKLQELRGILPVHQAVVEFIKWYNTQNQ